MTIISKKKNWNLKENCQKYHLKLFLARLISYIHHTCEYKQYCNVVILLNKQAGTVSRLRFCKRSWGLKIDFGWNIVRFWKSYICSNKLDVQETNFSFTQFNRIRNHFFGCRIEVGRDSRSWIMGSDRFGPWKHDSKPFGTWSLFSTSHDSPTQAISESDRWFG